MRVLIACEFSGVVREAFAQRGHDAWSCDLLPTEIPGQHYQCPVDRVLDGCWDLIVAHPPCTHLAVSGARWWAGREAEQRDAIAFARQFEPYADRVAVENPIGRLSTVWRKPDQIIQPWQFGHGEVKATCLWLKGLPKLVPTNIVSGREARVHKMPPSPTRWKERSKTLSGIASAMAQQWGQVDQPLTLQAV
jgi:hypothetical protein